MYYNASRWNNVQKFWNRSHAIKTITRQDDPAKLSLNVNYYFNTSLTDLHMQGHYMYVDVRCNVGGSRFYNVPYVVSMLVCCNSNIFQNIL